MAGETSPAPTLSFDPVELRGRLVLTRARLLERIANDWPEGRNFPDTAWAKLLGDIQACLQAVDDVLREAE